jgi:hypothetical protein
VQGTNWRHLGRIVAWLLVFPPVGLWFLWRDPMLTRGTKVRVLIYTVVALVALSFVLIYTQIHMLNRALTDAGIDF